MVRHDSNGPSIAMETVRMTLTETRRAAEEAIRTIDPAVTVVAAIPAEGGSDYTELVINGGSAPGRDPMVIGVDRTSPHDQFRARVLERYQQRRTSLG